MRETARARREFKFSAVDLASFGLAAFFILLKITGVIDWAWPWVLAPLWINVMFWVVAFFWVVALLLSVEKKT